MQVACYIKLKSEKIGESIAVAFLGQNLISLKVV